MKPTWAYRNHISACNLKVAEVCWGWVHAADLAAMEFGAKACP